MNKEQDYHALEKLKFPISIVHRSKKREWDFKEDWIERCEREREDNDLFYLGAALVTEVFEKNKSKSQEKQPCWKRRLESQVKELNKDLERLNPLLEGKKMKKKHQDHSQKSYKLKKKEKTKVKEENLQTVIAETAKVNRYQQRVS